MLVFREQFLDSSVKKFFSFAGFLICDILFFNNLLRDSSVSEILILLLIDYCTALRDNRMEYA